MKDDALLTLLREVKSGAVSIEDARTALEGVSLTEEQYTSAVDHGVFNKPKPGTVVRATISPSAESGLMVLFFVWAYFGPHTGPSLSPMDYSMNGISNNLHSTSEWSS